MKFRSPSFAVSATLFIGLQSAQAAVVLADSFTYPVGSLVGATGSPWVNHSGIAGQADVSGGAVNITSSETEDVNAPFASGPYTTGILTATFSVTFSVLPTTIGSYFAHFKDSATGFRSRLVANTTGAATGLFRLGISNGGGSVITTTNVGTDLSLATLYTVVMTWNLDTNSSTLSINGGTAVTAPDSTTGLAIESFALRQATGIGSFTMDNLSVDYIPEPSSAMFLGTMGMLGILRRRR